MAKPKFKNAEKFQEMIDNYFEMCDKLQKPYTMSGLALVLGTDRKTLWQYRNLDFISDVTKNDNEIKKISNSIKRAKSRCEAYLEEHLLTGKNPSGAIFLLKNNYGYVDRIVNDNSNYEIKVGFEDETDEELQRRLDQLDD